MKSVNLYIWSKFLSGNEKERMVCYLCNYDGECKSYNEGKCVCQDLFLGYIKCPHSKRITDIGVTKRAKSFGIASERWKEEYKTDIKIQNKVICECGDYIYLPYTYLSTYRGKIFEELENNYFLSKKYFDIEHIHKIITYKPYALMGGEITNYQKQEVPKFIRHLYENYNDLYNQYIEKYPEMKNLCESCNCNHVGRKAYLYTLNEGATFQDCHKNTWIKKDNYMVCENYSTWLAAGTKARKCMQKIMGDEIVEITSNDYVSEETIFVE